MRKYRARIATARRHLLAEGPLWDPVRERVFWVDLYAGEVHFGSLAGDLIVPAELLSFDQPVGAVVCAQDGTLLVAGRRQLITVEPSGERIVGPQLIPDDVDSRLNDGACDPTGRFIVGSMALDGRTGADVLCRISAGSVQLIDTDLTLSNGLAWSPDQHTMYSIDTVPGAVWARSVDPETGVLGTRYQPFPPISGEGDDGPDGMCVDVEGNLWIAIWGTGEVRCYSPGGDVLAVVEVDAPHVSSVAFVGPERDLLMITTASGDLTPEELLRHPNSGYLFTARVGTSGVPVPFWDKTR